MSRICKKVATRLQGLGGDSSENDVKIVFSDLVNDHFLQRVRPPMQDDAEQLVIDNEQQQFVIPSSMVVHGKIL